VKEFREVQRRKRGTEGREGEGRKEGERDGGREREGEREEGRKGGHEGEQPYISIV